MRPVIFLNSHPIQYFAPLYKKISESSGIDLTVWYCSDESITGKRDKGFGTKVKWDIPLLDGYKYRFLKNVSWKPSIYKGFFGLINTAVISALFHERKSIIVIHGWAYATHIFTILFGKMFGHKICLRAETPYNQELLKPRFKRSLKNAWLQFLFLFIDEFLYIGIENKKFLHSLGINESKMKPVLYCVDNDRFQQMYHSHTKDEAKFKLGFSNRKNIILFSGKYIPKKRPMDLIRAFHLSEIADGFLVMAGEGELRKEMEDYINTHKLQENIFLTGFINQSEIPFYYRSADIFVMCSGLGETWGLSVNEAMNFALPVIVSDTCGCVPDLVEDGVNGFITETGNVKQLSVIIKQIIEMSDEKKVSFQKAAMRKINNYSYKQNIEQLKLTAIKI